MIKCHKNTDIPIRVAFELRIDTDEDTFTILIIDKKTDEELDCKTYSSSKINKDDWNNFADRCLTHYQKLLIKNGVFEVIE